MSRSYVDEPLRVLVVGPHSSGKSTFAVALAHRLHGNVVELGDAVRMRIGEGGSGESLVLTAAALMAEDPLVIAKWAVNVARASEPPTVVVGPRTHIEFDYLCERLCPTLTVGVRTPTSIRQLRWGLRNLPVEDTWEDRERLESSWGTSELVQRCDITIAGTDTAYQVHHVINRLQRFTVRQ